jgi:NAD(P)-dependent dehydrogenase (short-subunit alcohol dehydrogenase family)
MTEAVLTTGTFRGIGLDAARYLAKRGYRSLGTVRREEDAAALRDVGVEPILMDVTDAESISRAAGKVERSLVPQATDAAAADGDGLRLRRGESSDPCWEVRRERARTPCAGRDASGTWTV